jgi:cytosine/adenosine deaminase-related metal-dependent hydrolase
MVLGSDEHLVMPGLVNGHFHVGMTPFRLGAADRPLEQWGLQRLGRRRLDPYLDHLYGALGMIRSGTTMAQVLHYGARGAPPLTVEAARNVIRAHEEAGLRIAYGMSVVDQNGLVGSASGGDEAFAHALPPDLAARFRALVSAQYQSVEEFVPKFESMLAETESERSVRLILTPSSVERCSDRLLREVARLSSEHDTYVHIHVQETPYQHGYAVAKWGVSPIRHLLDIGLVGPRVTCGHGVWVTDDDIEILADTGTRVCHNPSSNLRLHSGIAPLAKLLERGVSVALGTDEQGLNDDHDMFQEMRLAWTLHRLPGIGQRAPTAPEILEMATVGGTAGTPFASEVGTLEEGMRADLILLRMDSLTSPYVDPAIPLPDLIVRRARASDVETVMIDGRVVLRDRRHANLDIAEVEAMIRGALAGPPSPEDLELRRLAQALEPYLIEFLAKEGDSTGSPHYRYNLRENSGGAGN